MSGLRTIEWKGGCVTIINQCTLPHCLEYRKIRDVRAMWKAIRTMQIRGAPALGAAAALGLFLGIKDAPGNDRAGFERRLAWAGRYLATSRPTARNLFWGLERMQETFIRNRHRTVAEIKMVLLREARRIVEEDRLACRAIGEYGARLIRKGSRILTVCNAGALATIDYGTALGVIYRCQEKGKSVKVYACETRPLLQGARLTTWELKRSGVDVTLICDGMAASLMRAGAIDTVIAGADRIARNGDTANKIGTYALALAARYHHIPFYVAAPSSTFDLSIAGGKDIPIEQRPAHEVTGLFFKKPIAPEGVKVYNPAFDVTDHSLITAFITDRGIVRPPYARSIPRQLKKK